MDQNGPFWPEEVHFGPFRSANRTLAIPDFWDLFRTYHLSRNDSEIKSLSISET